MKKLKPSSAAQPASEVLVSSSLHSTNSRKKPIIIPIIQKLSLMTPKLLIKNQHFFKIHSNSLPLPSGFTKVTKRNAKYLKGTENYRFKSSSSLSLLKLANQLERTPSPAFSNSGRILELPSSLSSTIPPGRELAVKFLKNITKNSFIIKTLKLKFLPLDEDDDVQRKLYAKLLQRIFLLNLLSKSFYGEYWIMKKNEESLFRDLVVLRNINYYKNLKNITFEVNIRGCNPETFYHAFEVFSEIKNLEALKLSMNFSEIDKKGQNMKKTIAKFEKLKSLHLQLTFGGVLVETGKILTSLASFKNLKHLNVEFFSNLTVDYSEAVKFVTNHKSLETLKLTTRDMRFDEFMELFKGIQKMKSLTELSIILINKFPYSFAYGPVFKTLEALKKLKSFTLDLGHYGCDGKEMNVVFQHLLKHPSLEKVHISLKMDKTSQQPYYFDEDFYESIVQLRKKLYRGFELKLIIFNRPPFVQVYERVSKIINPSGLRSELFACSREFC